MQSLRKRDRGFRVLGFGFGVLVGRGVLVSGSSSLEHETPNQFGDFVCGRDDSEEMIAIIKGKGSGFQGLGCWVWGFCVGRGF